jgi:hypothetical protein
MYKLHGGGGWTFFSLRNDNAKKRDIIADSFSNRVGRVAGVSAGPRVVILIPTDGRDVPLTRSAAQQQQGAHFRRICTFRWRFSNWEFWKSNWVCLLIRKIIALIRRIHFPFFFKFNPTVHLFLFLFDHTSSHHCHWLPTSLLFKLFNYKLNNFISIES